MESSQVTGIDENEDCQSSESGWTMYLGSPQNDIQSVYDDDKNDEEHSTIDVEEENDNKVNKNDSDDSDDSMTSDASSGPKRITTTERRQGNEGKENMYSLDKKGKKKQTRSEIRKKEWLLF